MIYNLYTVADKKQVGNKAHNLMLLKRAAYNVPNGFVLSRDFCKLIKKSFSLNLKKQIKDYLKQIDYGGELYPLVVRSSSIYEDSVKQSFAGQFTSITNINNEKELFLAISKVIASEKKISLKSYTNKKLKDTLAVIIQKQIIPKLSGVYFTKNPITNKGFLIEHVKGHLEEMVSGKKNSLKINTTKQLNKTFKKLYLEGKQIEEYFKYPQDIEFAIDNKDRIWFLQTRNITTLKNIKKIIVNKAKNQKELKGITLSNGYAKGNIEYVSDATDPKEAYKIFKKGNILVTYVLFPEYDPIFKKAKAVICEVDSITSHPAIVARENNIPCIGGINISKLLKETNNFDEVIVDGKKGKVYYSPKLKILVNKEKSLFKMPKIIKTKEFENDKKELTKYILSLDYINIEIKLKNMVKFMQDNFKEYLKTKNKNNLNLASSYFRNLVPFLQEGFYKLLLKEYSKEDIISSFTRVDQGKKPITSLEKSYKVIRKYIQEMDKNATIDGKHLWDFDFKF
ncbi:MAG: PEP/pyruvate-binding domain-containing protein [archaeon]